MYAGWRTFDASRGDSTLEHPYVKRPGLHAVASYLLQEPKDGTARHTEGTTMYPAAVHGSMPQHTCDIAECRENKGR